MAYVIPFLGIISTSRYNFVLSVFTWRHVRKNNGEGRWVGFLEVTLVV
jgi:hypothetical protein